MHPLLIPFLSYSFLTIFTPGPSNVSASALGSKVGYRRSVPYIAGMCIGFLLVLIASGILTDFINENYARIALYLKWIGAAYIVWLAISLFLSTYKNQAQQDEVTSDQSKKALDMGFISGFLLLMVNPKGILFAITTFASFADLITGSALRTLGSAVFLTCVMFVATSMWTLTGAALTDRFHNKTFALTFNIVMALFLLYSAIFILLH